MHVTLKAGVTHGKTVGDSCRLSQGVLSDLFGGAVWPNTRNLYPISDHNLWFSISSLICNFHLPNYFLKGCSRQLAILGVSVCLSVYLVNHRSVSLCVWVRQVVWVYFLSVFLSVCLSICLSVCLFFCMYVSLYVCWHALPLWKTVYL